jgi:hypothetical protein
MSSEHQLAVHEASHAIVALRWGLEVASVSIVSSGNSAGRCSFGARSPDVGAARSASIKLAGTVGEQMAVGRKPLVNWLSDDEDIADANALLAHERNVFSARDLASLMAEITLWCRWDRVQRLAKALERRRVMVGDQIREVALGVTRIDPSKHFVKVGGRQRSLRDLARVLDRGGHHFRGGRPVGLKLFVEKPDERAERKGTAWQ